MPAHHPRTARARLRFSAPHHPRRHRRLTISPAAAPPRQFARDGTENLQACKEDFDWYGGRRDAPFIARSPHAARLTIHELLGHLSSDATARERRGLRLDGPSYSDYQAMARAEAHADCIDAVPSSLPIISRSDGDGLSGLGIHVVCDKPLRFRCRSRRCGAARERNKVFALTLSTRLSDGAAAAKWLPLAYRRVGCAVGTADWLAEESLRAPSTGKRHTTRCAPVPTAAWSYLVMPITCRFQGMLPTKSCPSCMLQARCCARRPVSMLRYATRARHVLSSNGDC